MLKSACIIAGTYMDGRSILFKNRDRAYDANLEIIHSRLEGVEIAVMRDLDSGYVEGINEHGIGIVNTALMVVADEQEGKSDKGKGKGPAKSKDAPKVLRALSKSTIKEALAELMKDPIRGHTFVCQGDTLLCIEASRTIKPRVQKMSMKRLNTRTNHGILYPEAGYTQGDDYVSSIVRRWETQKHFQQLDKPEEMAKVLYELDIHPNSMFNPVRDTEKMRTTNQVMFDLTNLTLNLYLVPGHSKFHGIKSKLKDPKISVKVHNHPPKTKKKPEDEAAKLASRFLSSK